MHPPAGLAEVVLTGQRPELGRRVGAGADGALGGRLAGGGGGGGGGAARSRGATAGGGGRGWDRAGLDLCLGQKLLTVGAVPGGDLPGVPAVGVQQLFGQRWRHLKEATE